MAKIWFGGAGILIVLLIAQSFGTVYQGHIAEVWSWALPTVMPTLSLIIAVLKSSALEKDDNQDSKQPKVKRRFYFVALWLSVFYLTLVVGSVLAAPIMSYLHTEEDFTNFDAMKLSNLWLAPIQGIVVGCMAALFFQTSHAET